MLVRRCAAFVLGVLIVASSTRPLLAAEANKPDAAPDASALDSVKRTLLNEPKYSAKPRYALLVLGENGQAAVWLVEDGKTLYVDRNGNGDLTDDGPPLEPTDVRNWKDADGNEAGDFNFKLDGAITPPDGPRHTGLSLARWKYDQPRTNGCGLQISLDGKTPMYAGWFGPFWADTPADAPLFHFGGPLTPHKLRGKEFVLGKWNKLSLCFANDGRGEGAATRLSIEALPKDVMPEVTIDWPVAAGSEPLRTTYHLDERCCYWEFYMRDVETPKAAVEGTAKLTVSFPPGVFPLALATDTIEVPVVASPSKSE